MDTGPGDWGVMRVQVRQIGGVGQVIAASRCLPPVYSESFFWTFSPFSWVSISTPDLLL